jgi:hypothetical protein
VKEQELLDNGYRRVTVNEPADRGFQRTITEEEVPIYNVLVRVFDVSPQGGGVGISFSLFLAGRGVLYCEASLHNAQHLTLEQAEVWCDRVYKVMQET